MLKNKKYILLLILVIIFITSCKSSDEKETKSDTKNTEIKTEEKEESVKIKINYDMDKTYQSIKSFGASGAWWSQDIGGWSEKNAEGVVPRDEIAKLLFDKEDGIGLSAYRYNIGAGSADNKKSPLITDFWRKTHSFLNENLEYDFTKDQNSIWFLEKAREYGVSELVFFSNSAPEHLTKNGNAYGTKDENGISSNLPKENYALYADYILDVTEHFINEGYNIKYVSPINEPQWEWIGGQEGCHFEPDEMVLFLKVFIERMNARNIKGLELAAPELGEWGNTSYKYYEKIFEDEVLSKEIKTLDVHSYWSDRAKKLSFKKYLTDLNLLDIKLRTSEWCEMVNGKDFSMYSAINLSDEIMTDLTDLNVTSFHYWIAVSAYDYRDGLLYVNKYTKEISETKRLYTMGNYSKFIRPGYTRIDAETDNQKVRVCAFKGEDKLVLTLINNQDIEAEINLDDFKDWKNKEIYLTNEKHNLEKVDSSILPKNSVATIILSN